MTRYAGERIELLATSPLGDVACDVTIATPESRAGLAEALASAIIPPVHEIEHGVEARFQHGAWDVVRRYVQLESRCCSFLTLRAERHEDAVVLRVTGREDVVPFIRSLFAR